MQNQKRYTRDCDTKWNNGHRRNKDNLKVEEQDILAGEEKDLANITKYAMERDAEGNKALLCPDYLKMRVAESLTNNTKLFISCKDIEIGGLLEKIIGAQDELNKT